MSQVLAVCILGVIPVALVAQVSAVYGSLRVSLRIQLGH